MTRKPAVPLRFPKPFGGWTVRALRCSPVFALFAGFLGSVSSEAFACDSRNQENVGISKEAFDFYISEVSPDSRAYLREGLSRWRNFYLTNCDLNDDDVDEYFLHIASSMTCSMGRAACGYMVYSGPPNREALMRCQGHVVYALETRTNGWRDLYCGTNGAEGWYRRVFVKTGKEYERSPALEARLPPMPWEKKHGRHER